MRFRVGQTVELVNSNNMGASLGATAIVDRVGDKYVYVTWIRDSKSKSQGDGGYFPWDFKPVIRQGEQLLFSFMG